MPGNQAEAAPHRTPPGGIVGGVIGGLVAVCGIAACAVVLLRRKRRNAAPPSDGPRQFYLLRRYNFAMGAQPKVAAQYFAEDTDRGRSDAV